MKLTALVPIKENSTRLPSKNFLDFGGRPMFEAILKTLSAVPQIDRIVINTDSQFVQMNCDEFYPEVEIVNRPEFLCGDDVTMNTIIDYDIAQLQGEHFLQTHATNPLLKTDTVKKAIDLYLSSLDKFDSLFAVDKIQKRAYLSASSPVNHSFTVMDQTQHLPPVYIENSNLFLFSKSSFKKANNNRIGVCPQLFPMHAIEGIDIDHEEDYKLAKLLYEQRFLGLEI
jgi:CMP-N-acetylneuraminic acid synthetase